MAELPDPLLERLGRADGAALGRAVDGIGEELLGVYATSVDEHREARGDNALLFGIKIWVRGEFRLAGRFEDDCDIGVVRANGSYSVRVGGLSMGVYKLGDAAEEDVHSRFPEASPTKRSYAERNGAQLALFEHAPASPLPPAARYGLDELIVGHFGNPREGLVKWYVGAPTTDRRGVRQWAWLAKQTLPSVAAEPSTGRPPMVPFAEREVEELEVRPHPGRKAS